MGAEPNSQMSSTELVARAEATRAALLQASQSVREGMTLSNMAGEVADAGSDALKAASHAAVEKPLTASAVVMSATALAAAWMASGRTKKTTRRAQPETSAARASKANASTAEPDGVRLPGTAKSGGARAETQNSILDDVLDIAPRVGLAIAAGYMLEKMIPRRPGEQALWSEVGIQARSAMRTGALGTLAGFAGSPRNPLPWLTVAAIGWKALTGKSPR
jgi:hypothetical protein